MKTELKRELFYSAKDLCNFVNEHQITKENIQSIVEDSEVYILFYWEVTVWNRRLARLRQAVTNFIWMLKTITEVTLCVE